MRFRSLSGTVLAVCLLSGTAMAADCGGRLVRVSDGKTISFDAVLSEAGKATLIAIGERHGLKEHVVAAACFLDKLNGLPGGAGRTALVVEHIVAEKQPLINAYRKQHPKDASGLGEAVQWAKSGWPAWPIYKLLYAAAFRGGNAVYGADQPKGTPTPSQDDLNSRLGGGAQQVVTAWAGIMNEAHCGILNEEQAEKFGRSQANRDLSMAGVVQPVLEKDGRVLFYSGREHGRKDISVPFVVSGKTKAAAFAVSLQETHIGKHRVSRREALREAKGRYDYLWFTGKAPQEDHCAVFRNRKSGKQDGKP